MDKAEVQEQEYMIDLYKHALGMAADETPGDDDAADDGHEAAAF